MKNDELNFYAKLSWNAINNRYLQNKMLKLVVRNDENVMTSTKM